MLYVKPVEIVDIQPFFFYLEKQNVSIQFHKITSSGDKCQKSKCEALFISRL